MKNLRETHAEELFELLSSISGYFEEEIRMYALGGTALTILGIKPSTRDIDININHSKEYNLVCKTFESLGFERKGTYRWLTQEGLIFDLFFGSNIMGTELLPDYMERAEFVKSFSNIKLYTLSLHDIIITKLARGDPRDFDDIRHILKNNKIDIKELVQRYKKTMEESIVADSKQKLLDLIEIKFKEWKEKTDKKLIDEVKSWEAL